MGMKRLRSWESKTRGRDLEIEIQKEHTSCRSVSLQLASPSLAEVSESNLSLCRDSPSCKQTQHTKRTTEQVWDCSETKKFSQKSLFVLVCQTAWDTQEASLASSFFLPLYWYLWTVRWECYITVNEQKSIQSVWAVSTVSSLCSFTIFLQQSSYC